MRYLTIGLVTLLVSCLSDTIANESGMSPDLFTELRGDLNAAYAQTNSISETVTSLPYLLDYSTLLNRDQSIDQALYSSSGIQPKLRIWGNANLTMSSIIDERGITFSRIDGSIGEQPSGFIAEDLDFQTRYILLTTGNIVKSNDSQLSFTFRITNSSGEYRLIFVHGPLGIEGWRDGNYYERLSSYSSRLIDLTDLLSPNDRNYSLEEITIVMQKETSYSAEFRIDLTLERNDIIRTGNIQRDRYVLHDLSFHRLIDVEYQVTSAEYEIVRNGWILMDVKERNEATAGLTEVSLAANQTSSELPSDLLLKLDVLESMSNLGSKDWLMLIFVLLSIAIYPFKAVKR